MGETNFQKNADLGGWLISLRLGGNHETLRESFDWDGMIKNVYGMIKNV